jgi:hypothetical protein
MKFQKKYENQYLVADQETRQFQHGEIRDWFFLSVVSRYLAAVE